MSALLSRIRTLLQGEPLRVIVYGAAVTYFIVAQASDRIPDVTFDQATVTALAAVTALTELARQLVMPVAVIESIVRDVTNDDGE